ncbi:HEAT domain-containing protein [Oryctes borbonicus]|uniref:HEAT domain-containing protein n=1 Tax=Oryctes borbonicus TaxID=1629725 RepID=A0A0T6BEX5_9SCAR|nr:HEAT domain-containing protein [Oryctes borbonicus]
MVWRILMDLFRTAPPDTMTTYLPHIMSVVSKLADEGDKIIRKGLIDQIPNLAVLARDCSTRIPALKTVVSEYFLPMVVRNLGTEENLVRKAAETSLFALMEHGLITKMEAEIQVCPTILALSREESATDNHVGAVTLMSKMASLLGRDVTERVFLDRFSQLCKNNTFYVRKACASHFGDFCSVVGKDAYEKILLPCYIGLCSDEVWGVRKACAEVAMSVSCACPPTVRRQSLAPIFIKLLQDKSRWVRMSAFQTLGPFISTFADPAISSVFYNNVGELMSVNPDGREFRVNSTSTLNRLYSLSENNFKEEDFIYDVYQGKEDDSVVMNPLSEICDDMSDEKEQETADITIDIPVMAEDPPDIIDHERKREDIILQKNMNVVSKAMLREETVNKIRAALEEKSKQETQSTDLTAETTKEDESENFKEIVETVKNALLSFRILTDEEKKLEEEEEEEIFAKCDSGIEVSDASRESSRGDLCDVDLSPSSSSDVSSLGNISSLKSNSDTTIVSSDSCEINQRTECYGEKSDSETKQTESEQTSSNVEEDSLHEYNSYNYWYIRPEMPVDLMLVNAASTATIQNSATINESSSISENTDQLKENQKQGDDSGEKPNNISTPTSEDRNNIQESNGSVPNTTSESKSKDDSTTGEKQPIKSQVQPEEELDWHGVPKLLIDHFVSMTKPSLAQETDNDMAFHCAYSLPAVALTLGSKNWHLLKDTVETLASDMQYKVRRTVASSLHELAVILGPEIATNNLTPIFDGFIKDLDEVRIGVLKHLAHFLRLINPSKRTMYLPRFADFLQSDNELNWRYRQELAEQLRLAVSLFRPTDAAKHMTSIAQVLLSDKVDAVRQTALSLLTELLKHISTEHDLTPRLLIILAERFAHAKRWKRRQTFALLCSDLLANNAIPIDLFASDVMPHLVDLSWDPVPNVRLVVARTLSKQIITNPYFSDPTNQYFDNLQTVLRRLQADKDQDVRHSALIENLTNFSPIYLKN